MKRILNLPILLSLVIGNMIGTGIFLLPASLAEYGTISILSWIFAAIGSIFLAFTLMFLNRRFPKTGGPYVYCKEAFGKLAGFVTAYSYYCGNLVSIAGIAVASIGYLGFVYPALDANGASYHPYFALGAEIGVIWFFTLINILGLHTAGYTQLFLTTIKVIPLLVIGLLGLGSIHLQNLMQFTINQAPSFKLMSSAAALTFWAFVGIEAATVPAENTLGHKVIYRATLYGVLITTFIYILCTIVLMGMIPATQLMKSQFPFAQAGTLLFGPNAATIIVLCAVISGLGALNACLILQGQIVFAAARDNLFPRRFGKLSKNDVPITGQILSSLLVSLFLLMTMQPTLLQQFDNIALITAILVLFTYCLTSLAELKFQLQSGTGLRRILFNKATLIASISALFSIWMIISCETKIILFGAGIIALCIPLYFFTVRNYSPVIEQEG